MVADCAHATPVIRAPHGSSCRNPASQPQAPTGRVLLRFEAVMGTARVLLNGAELGWHAGGYDHFAFDITKHVQRAGLGC